MARVVLPTFTDAQRSERELEVLDCNTWLPDPHPAFSWLEYKGLDGVADFEAILRKSARRLACPRA